MQAFFPDGLTPPAVFVKWLASLPVEIEMVAQLPPSDEPREPVVYFDPPEQHLQPGCFDGAVRQIYIAGLYAGKPSWGEQQANLLFGHLDEVPTKTGSDMRHLVKATYYTSDDAPGVLRGRSP